jgi:K+-sensing histidine kinase KdpD
MRATYAAAAVLAAGLISGSVVSAQNVPAALTKAREERADALAKGDRAVFDKLTTDQFVVTDPAGRVENKAERAARVTPPANPPQAPPAPHTNEKVGMYNNDTAVATWDASFQGTLTHFTEIWVKEKGVWKCAGAHVSRPETPRGEGRRGQ